MKTTAIVFFFACAICFWAAFEPVSSCTPTITIQDTNGTQHRVNKRDVEGASVVEPPATMDIVANFEFDENENQKNVKIIENRFDSKMFFQFGTVDRKITNDKGKLHISYTFPEATLYCNEFIKAAKNAIFAIKKEAIETKASCKDLLI